MKKLVFTVMFVSLCACGFAAATHTVRTGDTLWALAAKHYGDPTLYPILLKVNNITNPRTILNGTVIYIPDIEDMRKIANETDSAAQKQLINKARSAAAGSSQNTPASTSGSQGYFNRKPNVNPSDITINKTLNARIKQGTMQSVSTSDK